MPKKSKLAAKLERASQLAETGMLMMAVCHVAEIDANNRRLVRNVFHPELIMWMPDPEAAHMRATALGFAAAMARTGDL